MTLSRRGGGQALRGRTIFLSASVPSEKRADRYNRVENAAFEIEQAVISLARAVFSEGGRLVFGGHPAISPLVAMVVGEYREPRFTEHREERRASPVDIFQSRAFEDFLPEDTLLMYKLGYASIHWVEAVDGERFQPDGDLQTEQCPKSLNRMREAMLKEARPDAMVCIGGMEGLEDEVQLAITRLPALPIFVLERTGGASALLRGRAGRRLRMIDTEIMNDLDRIRSTTMSIEQGADPRPHRALVPYPLVMQTIVEEVAQT